MSTPSPTPSGVDRVVEGLLREHAPQVLAALVRRHGMFDLCEDATQEALLAAATQWPAEGVPANPRGWLMTVAARRLTDQIRSDAARRRREHDDARHAAASGPLWSPAPDEQVDDDRDDSLTLLFLCCHPDLSPPSQIALTLRSLGGLTTTQIARAFLVPDATMAQRISRAKAALAHAGARFEMPSAEELGQRLDAVMRVLYLIFNEGYTAASGPDLLTVDLTTEAIRMTRQLRSALPDHSEVAGLLALMLLTDARRSARLGPSGELIPLVEQDRALWDQTLIAEGVAIVTTALAAGPPGPYQVQAAIAAVHDEAPDVASTDWVEILGLYAVLERLEPNPVIALNRAIALAMVSGPSAGLRAIEHLADDPRVARGHRLPAVRAHLYEMAGDLAAAREEFLAAARRTTSQPEKRYLEHKAALLHPMADGGPKDAQRPD